MTTMISRLMMTAAAAVMVVPAVAAHAEKKPTILLVHRNIQKQADEQNWEKLAINLSADGYRVVSFAMALDDTTPLTRDGLLRVAKQESPNDKLLVVSTAAASDMAAQVVEAAPDMVKAIVYITAEPTVATLGPRTVSEPNDLVGKVPSYQIRISANQQTSNLYERGATSFRVREQGTSTLAKLSDLQDVIETIATTKTLSQRAAVEAAAKPVAGAL
jgi:hypothetical protein